MNNTNQVLLSVCFVIAIVIGVAVVADKYYANCSTLPFLNKTVCVAGNK